METATILNYNQISFLKSSAHDAMNDILQLQRFLGLTCHVLDEKIKQHSILLYMLANGNKMVYKMEANNGRHTLVKTQVVVQLTLKTQVWFFVVVFFLLLFYLKLDPSGLF